jgi:hypothetical protein
MVFMSNGKQLTKVSKNYIASETSATSYQSIDLNTAEDWALESKFLEIAASVRGRKSYTVC